MRNIVLFDFDGTLFDTGSCLAHALGKTLEHYGIPVPEREKLFGYIGPTIRDTFTEVFHMPEKDLDAAVQMYRDISEQEGYDRILPYPGIAELLRDLHRRGMRLAVATSKPEVYAEDLSRRFGIYALFSSISGSAMDGRNASKPDMIRIALERMGVAPGEYDRCIMVGDRKYDVLGAKELGIACFGVTYGFGTAEELYAAGAEAVTDTVEGLHELLLTDGSR